MILILTGPDDSHADAVRVHLDRRGVRHVRVDPADVPTTVSIAFGCVDGRVSTVLRTATGDLDLAEVSSIWLRRPGGCRAHLEVREPQHRAYAEAECRDTIDGILEVPRCAWVPAPLPVVTRASHKPLQLRFATDLGFDVPATVITNDPDELLAFWSTHHGDIVSKLPSPAMGRVLGAGGIARYTQRVTRADLAHLESLRYAPMVFQEYVPKRSELRITVIGEQVFAAEIQSQKANRTKLDWRRYDPARTPHAIYDLPVDIQRKCIDLVREMGLCYGAIDMVVTPEGNHVFLEINPAGQFLWIEQSTGLPICEALSELLMADGGVMS